MHLGQSRVCLLLLVALLAGGCGLGSSGSEVGSTGDGGAGTASVEVEEFWVEPEDGRLPVLQAFGSATRTLDVVVYLLTDKVVTDGIIEAHRRGVRVRVMVEEDPFGGGVGNEPMLKRLRAARVPWKFGNPTYRYTHEKAVIVDRQRALVMTANLTKSAFTRNREYIAAVTSPGEVREIAALFDADWKRTAHVPRAPALVVSDVNSRDKLLTLIDSARESMEIEAEVMADREIRAALVSAGARGVRVRVVMSTPEPDESSYEGLSQLAAAGIGVRTVDSPYIHAKSVLVDGARAYIGSINFTATSMDQNRELGVITRTRSVLNRLRDTFEADWSKGRVFVPEG